MTELRALTAEEVRDKIIHHMKFLATYWANVDGVRTTQERIEGAMFSTLAMLDGCCPDIPAFDLVAQPHDDDEGYHRQNRENWIPKGLTISTAMHEFWHR